MGFIGNKLMLKLLNDFKKKGGERKERKGDTEREMSH